ncbi:MAG: putative ABC transporter permease [Bacilli bacterium]|nr:putative ABC transporter permease [Bacilli bacterium]
MFSKYFNDNVLLSKKQIISIILLIIVISGIFGWLYEFIFYYFNSGMKVFYMRGGNFLPWINIYAYGAFLILFLTCKVRKHPLQVFLISVISTGILEYLSGYILYGKLGWIRCWDYNQEILNFGNINGYVCLRSVLVFGFSGLLLMYVIIPILIKLVNSKYLNVIFIISIVFCSLVLFDEIYNLIFTSLFNLPSAPSIYKTLGFKYLYFK